MHRLIIVMFMSFSMEICKCTLENLIYCGFATTSWSHTHQSMSNELSFIELNNFVDLNIISMAYVAKLHITFYLSSNQL